MENKKKKHQRRYEENTLSIYVPKEVKQQLMFVCQLKQMPMSEFCRKILQIYLSKKNIEKLMLDYALEHIQAQNTLTQN